MVPFVLITTLFFLWGFARAILDVLNKHFQNEMHISITQSSLIQVTTYMGYFLMAIPAGLFINRFGYRRGVVFGLLLFALGSWLFVPCTEAGTFDAYLFALFIISVGLVFLETAANPYVTELGGKNSASSRLNLSQSFNGLGCLFATFAVGQFLFGGDGNVEIPYVILGFVVLVIAGIFTRVDLPEIRHNDGLEEKAKYGREPLMRIWHHKFFVYGRDFYQQLLHQLRYRHGMDGRSHSIIGANWRIGILYGWPFWWQLHHAMDSCRKDASLLRLWKCGLHHAGTDEFRTYLYDRSAGQLPVRGNYVPHHLLAGRSQSGLTHQECIQHPYDDTSRRMRIPVGRHHCRRHRHGSPLHHPPTLLHHRSPLRLRLDRSPRGARRRRLIS